MNFKTNNLIFSFLCEIYKVKYIDIRTELTYDTVSCFSKIIEGILKKYIIIFLLFS